MQPLLCRDLVDRAEAVAAVSEAVRNAASGAGGLVFVVGDAGIGKSRLIAEARGIVGGFIVLAGRAVDRAAPAAYRPIVEALQPLLVEAETGAAGTGRGFPQDVQPLIRTLRRLLPDGAQEAAEPAELAVAEVVTQTLGTLGRSTGCLLLLEDLHWADPETLAVLEYLSDHVRRHRVLVLATIRSGEASPAEHLAGLLRERRSAVVVSLRPLGADATSSMVASCLGVTVEDVPTEVKGFIHTHAEGVPLFVEELLSALSDAGALAPTASGWKVTAPLVPVVPITYADATRRRLHHLDHVARDVLLAAAVLGRRFDWALLPGATGRPETEVISALGRATTALLVEPEGTADGFRFRHALARDAVLSELLAPEQATVAARALEALESAGPLTGDRARLAAELAERAGDRRRAVLALVEVAKAALWRGALASARGALERAAALARSQPELSLVVDESRAHAAALAGDVDGAIRTAAVVLGSLPSGEEHVGRRADLHLTLARAALVAGRNRDAARHVDDALRLSSTLPTVTRAAAEALGAQVAIATGLNDEAASFAHSALDHAGLDAPAAACEALEVLGRLARPVDVDEAEARFTAALEVAERHHLALWRARALHELGTIDLYAGRRRHRFAEARAAAVDAGAVATMVLCDLHLTVAGYAHWEPEPGIESGRRCVDLSRRLGMDTLGMGLVHLATCHGIAGQAAEMEAVLDQAAPFALEQPDVATGIPGRARMALALRLGNPNAAKDALDEAMEVLRRYPAKPFPFLGLWALLSTTDTVGDAGGGVVARKEVQKRSATGADYNHLCLTLAEAMVLGRSGDRQGATAVVTGQLEKLAMHQGQWGMVALALTASSALDEGWGDGGPWIRRALARFEEAGFPELASWCRAVLRRSGHVVPRQGRGTLNPSAELRALGITSRELDVLAVLAGGATNKEIASRLHLSPRTVERHVSNLLAKTGAGDRHELSRYMGGQNP